MSPSTNIYCLVGLFLFLDDSFYVTTNSQAMELRLQAWVFFPLTNKDTELMHFDFLYEFHLHLKFIFHILKFVNVVIFLYLRVGLCAEYEALNPGKLILLSVLKMTNISLDDDRTPKGAGSLSPEYTPREGEVSFFPSNS